MIIKENTDLCKKLKNKINIDLNFDILINKCMAVYPSKYCSPNCVSYTKEYVVCEDNKNTKQHIDVIEWNFNDRTYLLDTYTNNVYDPAGKLYLNPWSRDEGGGNHEKEHQLKDDVDQRGHVHPGLFPTLALEVHPSSALGPRLSKM